MTLILPPLARVMSPNYSSRGGAKVRLIVNHSCEGNSAGTVAWFGLAKSRVSAHAVLREDGVRATQCVDWRNKAWAVCDYNSVSESIEAGGFGEKGLGAPEWQALANITAFRLKANSLPPVWAKGGVGEGFCQHADLGVAGGGHHDITSDPAVWDAFCRLVEDAYVLPMPATWLSDGGGVPAAPPPDFKPDMDPRHDHAEGSLEWVQLSLNALKTTGWPLTVDGIDGTETRTAVRKFQRAHGLVIDGEPGPVTCAAIVKDIAAMEAGYKGG